MTTQRIDIGYKPHEYQAEIHNNLKRFSVLACHRRFGKTYLAINTLVAAGLRTKKKAGRFFYLAPFRSQAKTIAWDYLLQFVRDIPGITIKVVELIVELPNGTQIRLMGP